MEDRHIIASNQLHIRSKDCIAFTTGITTDFHLTLETPISCYNDEMIVVSLTTAEIPYTFFGVNNNNNYLQYQEYDYNAGTTTYSNPRTAISIQITEGNYSIYQLGTELVKQMNNNSVFSSPYSYSYDDITNTFSIIITGAVIGCKLLTNTGTQYLKSIFKQLGYTADSDFLFNSTANASSDGNVDLATIHSLYLRSNLGLVNTLSSANRNITNILAKIPINCNPLEMIYFQPNDRSGYNLLQQRNIKHFHLSITDQNDNVIDLGKNINWELSLVFDIIKKPKRTFTPYNTIDFSEKITLRDKPYLKPLPISDLYNEPIRDTELRPIDIQHKIDVLRKDDIEQDKRFKNEVDELEDKIKTL